MCVFSRFFGEGRLRKLVLGSCNKNSSAAVSYFEGRLWLLKINPEIVVRYIFLQK